MKKYLALILVAVLALALCACSKTTTEETTVEETTAAAVVVEGVMTHEEFIAAELDTEVAVATYVQATQGCWYDETAGSKVTTLYTQAPDGAYFIYQMAVTDEDYAKMTEGTMLKITGTKSAWSGEVEIVDAKYEFVDGSDTFVAEAKDTTEDFGNEADMNSLVAVKGATVVAANDEGAAYLYKWDGSGEQGDDLYYKVAIGENEYTLVVESYLCGPDTDTYKAVEALEVGQTVDVEGFLYWYEGAQLHTTAITVAEAAAK